MNIVFDGSKVMYEEFCEMLMGSIVKSLDIPPNMRMTAKQYSEARILFHDNKQRQHFEKMLISCITTSIKPTYRYGRLNYE